MMPLKNLAFSISSGILLAVSWPTYGFTPLLFVALIPLLFLEKRISEDTFKRKDLRIWAYGYLDFLIWNVSTTWWIVHSTVWGMIFANICNSLFYSILFLIFHKIKKSLPLRTAYIFLVCSWIAFEKFHLYWDFSWPWLHLGNAFSETIYWVQWYEFTGVLGGSLWVLAVNIGLYEVFKKHHLKTEAIQIVQKSIPWLLVIALPIVFSLILYMNVTPASQKVKVLMLQPNIDPYDEKYRFSNQAFLDLLKQMTVDKITPETDYLLTPETYFAEGYGERLLTFERSELHRAFQEFLSPYPNLQLVTGIQFYDLYNAVEQPTLTANKYPKGNFWVDYYNTALAEQYQQNFDVYHKSKLVVGVENMPFKKILNPLLGSVMIDLGGTVSSRAIQKKRSVFTHGKSGIKTGSIICYESIYGEFVTGYVKNGAHFLSVISNDAWWENTEGHKQLLSYTRLRAIETRRAIARSANTGISAIINEKGEVVSTLEYGTKGVLSGWVSVRNEWTFYTRFGDIIGRWSAFIVALFLLMTISKVFRKQT